MIEIKNLNKIFKVPHERRKTLFETLVGGVKRDYELIYALKDINLRISSGEAIGIIGPNGSGKSTLLRIISGIYKSTNGSISVNGSVTPILDLGAGLQDDLSGKENIYLYSTLLGVRRKEIEEKFEHIVEFSDIKKFIDTRVEYYSYGMRARLAFSIVASINTDILVSDEIYAVGDINFQQKCHKMFKELKENGKTLILVSHSTSDIQNLCDRVVLLENGRITMVDKPKKVINYYTNKYLVKK